MTVKMIKDPIHGSIEFKGAAEIELKNMLSDPFFQRLRRVKQLGFSDYVFPSATHTRFAHSLGVYAVAKRMLSVVEPTVLNGDWSQKGKACLAAALLHDVGHGMFSHAFESAMKLYLERNSNNVNEKLGDAVSHEKVSCRIITNSSIAENLERLGGSDFPKMVSDLITKTNKGCIYTSIVSGQLDADRLDYAKRDPYFAGVSSGGIDLDWLIRNFKVGESKHGSFLYVNSKAYVSLEQFTVTLFQLYPTLYLHKRARGLEIMFSLLMSRVFELIAAGDECAAGLFHNHPLVRFFREPRELQNALPLDDTLFWATLHLFQEARDQSIQKISKRIALRKIYPMHDIWKFADKAAAQSTELQNLNASARVARLHEICKQVAEELRDTAELWTDSCYYDNYPRPIYSLKLATGGHPQQINVEVGGEIVDIASISPIVASTASFNIHRIYYDDDVDHLGDNLAKNIESSVQRKLSNKPNGKSE